jgi:hypothetical protein
MRNKMQTKEVVDIVKSIMGSNEVLDLSLSDPRLVGVKGEIYSAASRFEMSRMGLGISFSNENTVTLKKFDTTDKNKDEMNKAPVKPMKPRISQYPDTAAGMHLLADDMTKYEKDMGEYSFKKSRYEEQEKKNRENYKAAVLADAGLYGHLKAEKIWTFAMREREYGTDGFAQFVDELADLVR